MTFQEILDERQITYVQAGGHHHARPGWLNLDCPFCGPDSNRFHLGFNLFGRYAFCWKCGYHYLDKVLGALGFARHRIREVIGDLDAEVQTRRGKSVTSLQIPRGLGPLLTAHTQYLRERGFDPAEIERIWGIKGIGLASRLAWRIYIPVTQRGKQVTWTTRAIGDRVEQRYISAPAEQESVNIKRLVYGRENCQHTVVVVEGPTDAWAVGPGAGALFGTAFSSSQVRELISIPRRFVCFDSSPEAQRKAEELADQLSCFPGTTENICLDAKDPGSATQKEIRLLRRVAGL